MRKIILILPLFFGLRLLAADFNDYFKNSFEDSISELPLSSNILDELFGSTNLNLQFD